MIKVLIVGGKLQGIEIAYLAKKAGYYTIILDKNGDAPAIGLADRFVKENVFSDLGMLRLFEEADAIIPAIEDDMVLHKLLEYGEITGKKVIFDEGSYRISSSKTASNKLFESLDLPLPGKFPECQYPVIIKPDNLCGSSQVKKACSREEAEAIIAGMDGEIVIQEYLEGRSFSLEVIGDGENFYYPQITEVITDESYDSKRIIAPGQIGRELEEQFLGIACKLAESLKIKGIFDIEVICHNGTLKLLEIDARFPSQTPVSIYNSSGINMVEMLVGMATCTCHGGEAIKNEVCLYQQIVVGSDEIRVQGEHIIGDCRKMTLIQGFFGADEGITDYCEGKTSWKAIIIITADTCRNAYEKFRQCMENIRRKMNNPNLVLIEG
ncbi:MAG: 3-methylornithine--L-lysine ligase PylC [Clostridiales bacterium]|nr:3-methylornithine--L-lysine ligase PylC [Clostridiales bacterium]